MLLLSAGLRCTATMSCWACSPSEHGGWHVLGLRLH